MKRFRLQQDWLMTWTIMIVFIVLKFTHQIDWPMGWVLSPPLFMIAFYVIFGIIGYTIYLISENVNRTRDKGTTE